MALKDKLVADARDIALAAFAAAAASFALYLVAVNGGATIDYAGLKIAAITAGYAGIRAAAGALASKLGGTK
jgi:hypothetical protein